MNKALLFSAILASSSITSYLKAFSGEGVSFGAGLVGGLSNTIGETAIKTSATSGKADLGAMGLGGGICLSMLYVLPADIVFGLDLNAVWGGGSAEFQEASNNGDKVTFKKRDTYGIDFSFGYDVRGFLPQLRLGYVMSKFNSTFDSTGDGTGSIDKYKGGFRLGVAACQEVAENMMAGLCYDYTWYNKISYTSSNISAGGRAHDISIAPRGSAFKVFVQYGF